MSDLTLQARQQAKDLAQEGVNGTPNLLVELADTLERAEEFARVCNAKTQSYLEQLAVEMARVKELEKWRDAVYGIVDGLDDPYRGNSWQEVTQELCARELEHLRSVLVPLVRGEEK